MKTFLIGIVLATILTSCNNHIELKDENQLIIYKIELTGVNNKTKYKVSLMNYRYFYTDTKYEIGDTLHITLK